MGKSASKHFNDKFSTVSLCQIIVNCSSSITVCKRPPTQHNGTHKAGSKTFLPIPFKKILLERLEKYGTSQLQNLTPKPLVKLKNPNK